MSERLFHLCQPGEGASCGACCGLYNFRERSREAVTRALRRRTEVVRAQPRTAEAYRTAARSLRRWDKDPLFPPVRVCPLLGFLDEAETRVGCLAHPKTTGGLDLRDCGAYDARTCQSFECPSFLWLTPGQAHLVRAACPDFYLYGLVITDVELVRGLERILTAELARPPDLLALARHRPFVEAAARFFARKEHAPGRPPDADVYGRFARDDQGEPVPRVIEYEALDVDAAPEDEVVLCLGYAPETAAALEAARELVRAHVRELAAAIPG